VTVSLRSTWILLAAFSLGLTLACGGDSQEAAPPSDAPAQAAPPPAAPPPAETPAIPPQVWSGEFPADFPADVPRYPGARVIQARVAGDGGTAVSLTTKDEMAAVKSFLADSLAAEGWSTDIRETPEGHAIFADKGSRSASAIVHAGGDGTLIDIITIDRR
jgi:hypothetical protein